MMETYLERGHTVTIDNWYTTPWLDKYLLHRSTKVVGTAGNNFPKDFPGGKEMQKGSAVFKEHKKILATKYRGAKDITAGKPKTVHVISTKHSAIMVITSKVDGPGNTVRKP